MRHCFCSRSPNAVINLAALVNLMTVDRLPQRVFIHLPLLATNRKDPTMSEKKQPAQTIPGTVGSGNRLQIWENQTDEGRSWYNGVLSHSYKDQSGQWHETKISINSQDFLDLAEMFRDAHAFVKQQLRAHAEQQRQEAGQDTPPAAAAAEPAGHVERERKRAGGRQR
jgi:hypothetical protein